MSTQPLYPAYLPTRPDGFQPTIDVPYFEAEEPGTRAKASKTSVFRDGARVENITPRVGSEVRGIQLSQLSKAGLDEVALLAAERGVLVFRDQDFADVGFDKQKEIVRHYGPLHQHPTMGYPEGTSPEFHVVYADEKAGNLRTLLGPHTSYDLWHVDQTFTPNVPSTTFFWVLEQPASGGGDTAFTSLTAAYAALSPAFRRTLHGLRLFHTSASVGEVARVGTERALKEAVSTTHPLVIKHPVTGAPSLFVNPTIARRVEGFLPEESDALLGFLHNHIKSLDFSCRVRWEKGTVVVWDQRSTAHSAVPDFRDGERRHMVRIIPYGSRPEPAFPEEHKRAQGDEA
ncbi:alpha-ketoglutarate-dependent sulfonate dioxygenase [Colletotrichum spaethianum]|uniref:Alpha-ketoglutarate-dependent sulfonate dioxygenase n=1 Tax=Colletotrichum spaethianum TaxID=700344 RepID=A0AA37P7E4_9PEZI|nr:alpha-ketoglutarate-dependent sulfonate dioxygenase [Colletotrichum spaethianum]GKT43474.1 alpha-ketoglutarate-dependent sulfonate dioxygenase [Colletotrichum spaethianum]